MAYLLPEGLQTFLNKYAFCGPRVYLQICDRFIFYCLWFWEEFGSNLSQLFKGVYCWKCGYNNICLVLTCCNFFFALFYYKYNKKYTTSKIIKAFHVWPWLKWMNCFIKNIGYQAMNLSFLCLHFICCSSLRLVFNASCVKNRAHYSYQFPKSEPQTDSFATNVFLKHFNMEY